MAGRLANRRGRAGHRCPARLRAVGRAPTGRVSVRQRADYVREEWQLPPEYYEQVVGHLRGAGVEEVVLQADEPAFVPWLRRFMESAGLQVADHVALTGDRARDDFWNLAAAATIVIPNSTFSWWAAAVATARDPEVSVLYPDPWLPNRWIEEPVPDMGLPGWTVVSSFLPPIDRRPVFRLRPAAG